MQNSDSSNEYIRMFKIFVFARGILDIIKRSHLGLYYSDVSKGRQGKRTAIRLIAVRETSVSRQHGDPVEGPLETPRTSLHYRTEGIRDPLSGLPLCRETPIFRAINVSFSSLGYLSRAIISYIPHAKKLSLIKEMCQKLWTFSACSFIFSR